MYPARLHLLVVFFLLFISSTLLISQPVNAQTTPSVINEASANSSLPPTNSEEKITPINITSSAALNNLFSTLLEKHNTLIVIACFWVFGVLLAMTPCVLPLVFIIAGLLGGRTGEITHNKTILLVLTYVTAMSFAYALIGIVAFYTGIYIEFYFQIPWVLACFSVLITLLALSSIGFYKLQLPTRIARYVAEHSRYKTHYEYIEVAFMGVLGTLVVSPCVLAPLIAVLLYLDQYGNMMLSSTALFFFGLGIGTPLLLVTCLGRSILPQAGPWQYSLKIIFGLLLLCVAIWLSSRLIPFPIVQLLWSITLVFTATFMLSHAFTTTTHQCYITLWKSVGVLLMAFAVSLFLMPLINSTGLINQLLNNVTSMKAPVVFQIILDQDQLDAALQYSKQIKKPAVILFTSSACPNCQEFENNVLEQHVIQQYFQNFLLLKIDLSSITAQTSDILTKYGILGTPEVIFYSASGILSKHLVIGNVGLASFEATLGSILKEK